jgi:D-sedoheptulose 7-phosphate isomerase
MAKKAENKIEWYIKEIPKLIQYIDSNSLFNVSNLLARTTGRIYICGNGGSSCTAQHISEDFRLLCGLDTHCLSDNIGCITAIANDVNYESIFSLQLKEFATHRDILIVISGSGNSMNIIRAIETAKEIGMWIIAIVGTSGGKVKKMKVNDLFHIRTDMQHFEDFSLILGHILTINMIDDNYE